MHSISIVVNVSVLLGEVSGNGTSSKSAVIMDSGEHLEPNCASMCYSLCPLDAYYIG